MSRNEGADSPNHPPFVSDTRGTPTADNTLEALRIFLSCGIGNSSILARPCFLARPTQSTAAQFIVVSNHLTDAFVL